MHSDQILMYAIVFQVVKGKRYWEDGGMGKKKMGGGKAIMFALGKGVLSPCSQALPTKEGELGLAEKA